MRELSIPCRIDGGKRHCCWNLVRRHPLSPSRRLPPYRVSGLGFVRPCGQASFCTVGPTPFLTVAALEGLGASVRVLMARCARERWGLWPRVLSRVGPVLGVLLRKVVICAPKPAGSSNQQCHTTSVRSVSILGQCTVSWACKEL